MSSTSLTDLRVLITRPQRQQPSLCEAIEQLGGVGVSLPLIAIEPLEDGEQHESVKRQVQELDRIDVLIFVSSNAARLGAEWINNYWPQFPVGVQVIAVGPTTASALAALLGCEVLQSESGMTSEDLLTLPELNAVEGKRVTIVRGQGGRELLGETLRERGASVSYLEVYRRQALQAAPGQLNELLAKFGVNVLTVHSGESLRQLDRAAGDDRETLHGLPLIVPSARLAAEAERIGFAHVKNAKGADDASFIEALQEIVSQADNADRG